ETPSTVFSSDQGLSVCYLYPCYLREWNGDVLRVIDGKTTDRRGRVRDFSAKAGGDRKAPVSLEELTEGRAAERNIDHVANVLDAHVVASAQNSIRLDHDLRLRSLLFDGHILRSRNTREQFFRAQGKLLQDVGI